MPRISKFTDEQQAAAVAQANQVAEGQTKGARLKEVADSLGISTGTLGIWMRKANGTENGTAVEAPKKARGRPKGAGRPATPKPAAQSAAVGTGVGDISGELMRIRSEIKRLQDRLVQLVLS